MFYNLNVLKMFYKMYLVVKVFYLSLSRLFSFYPSPIVFNSTTVHNPSYMIYRKAGHIHINY